jgi:Acyl-protein synthetase, LuxE
LEHLYEKIEALASGKLEDFEHLALEIFAYQARYNPLYAEFLKILGKNPAHIQRLEEIPFLPISFFKTHSLQTFQNNPWAAQNVFKSSGTTQSGTRSQHLIRSLSWYLDNARAGFEQIFKKSVSEYCFLALLPNYLQAGDSSLVAMLDDFIQHSDYTQSGFYLDDFAALQKQLIFNRQHQIPTFLWGVTYALLDFSEQFPTQLPDFFHILETGGMKGRRKELTRPELHQRLAKGFGRNQPNSADTIFSEYGMTELLSQAYSTGKGIFTPAPTLKVLVRDINDPFAYVPNGQRGGLNLIDLANIDTISFIATDDLGIVYNEAQFEVLGRLQASDLRGCNLLGQ